MSEGVYAKIVADSIYADGPRLTTFEVRFHRFVLAEFNTHRVFSRNSASSRAIPLRRQLERVRNDPAFPIQWPGEQGGMQGDTEQDLMGAGVPVWAHASEMAARDAELLGKAGVHKSVANRLLEPFMWHTAVVTATSWQNFFGLRCNPMAQPEIRVAAEAMAKAYADSNPVELVEGQWHLPYIDQDTWAEVVREFADGHPDRYYEKLVKISAARCARVSYLTQNGVRDIEEDVALYERLTSADPMHASPLEHVATPAPWNQHEVAVASHFGPGVKTLVLPEYGNLLGWHQNRFDIEVSKNYQAYS